MAAFSKSEDLAEISRVGGCIDTRHRCGLGIDRRRTVAGRCCLTGGLNAIVRGLWCPVTLVAWSRVATVALVAGSRVATVALVRATLTGISVLAARVSILATWVSILVAWEVARSATTICTRWRVAALALVAGQCTIAAAVSTRRGVAALLGRHLSAAVGRHALLRRKCTGTLLRRARRLTIAAALLRWHLSATVRWRAALGSGKGALVRWRGSTI